MPAKSSRPASRVPSRRPSRAPSVASADAASDVRNASFSSSVVVAGHAVVPPGNMDEMEAAAAAITGQPHRRRSRTEAAVPPAGAPPEEGTPQRSRSGSAAAAAPDVDPELALPDDVSVFGVVKQFIVVGYPLSISALAQFSLNTVIVSVNGKLLGDVELGAAGLAVGLVNATGFAFGAGLCGALETVLSQTYGAYERKLKAHEDAKAAHHAAIEAGQQEGGGSGGGAAPLAPGLSPDTEDGASSDHGSTSSSAPPDTLYMYGIYTQRMTVILFFVAFPLGVILCFADLALQTLGESREVLHYTGVWCRAAVFGIPAAMGYQLVQRYYASQRVTKPLSIAMLIAALSNPVLQIVFVKAFGFHGSPIAWLVLMTGIVGGLICYLWLSGLYKLTWGGLSSESLRGLGSLASIAAPSMGVMLSEWVALEVNALASGFAPTEQLAAFSITLQTFGMMWGIGSGVMILSCVFVGNAIGAQKPLLGRRIALIALGLMFCIAVLDVIVFFSLGPFIPWIFTSDPKVVEIYHKLMYIVLPYHIVDTLQSTVMGILRGCGLQKIGAVIICTAFCIVGVPTSFLLFFYFDIGVEALWIGPFFGVGAVASPAYVYIFFRYIKWEELKPHEGDAVLPTEDDGDTNSNPSNADEEGVEPATNGSAVREYVNDAAERARSGALKAAK